MQINLVQAVILAFGLHYWLRLQNEVAHLSCIFVPPYHSVTLQMCRLL